MPRDGARNHLQRAPVSCLREGSSGPVIRPCPASSSLDDGCPSSPGLPSGGQQSGRLRSSSLRRLRASWQRSTRTRPGGAPLAACVRSAAACRSTSLCSALLRRSTEVTRQLGGVQQRVARDRLAASASARSRGFLVAPRTWQEQVAAARPCLSVSSSFAARVACRPGSRQPSLPRCRRAPRLGRLVGRASSPTVRPGRVRASRDAGLRTQVRGELVDQRVADASSSRSAWSAACDGAPAHPRVHRARAGRRRLARTRLLGSAVAAAACARAGSSARICSPGGLVRHRARSPTSSGGSLRVVGDDHARRSRASSEMEGPLRRSWPWRCSASAFGARLASARFERRVRALRARFA